MRLYIYIINKAANHSTERHKMIDSLAIAIALLATPTARPNRERVATVRAPAATSFVQLARNEESAPERATTCYIATVNGCWTEN